MESNFEQFNNNSNTKEDTHPGMISIDLNQETPGDMQMSGNFEMQASSSGFRFIRG